MTALRRGIWQPTQRQWAGIPFEVDLSHPLARGLVGYWLPGIHGGGNVLRDLSGHTNRGSFGGNPTWTRSPKWGQTLDFDGVSDYVDVTATDSLKPAKITVSLWINPASPTTNYGRILSRADDTASTDNSWIIQFIQTTGRPYFTVWNEAGASQPSPITGTAISADEWSHFVGQYDGSTVRHFINAVPSVGNSLSGTLKTGTRPLRMATTSNLGGNKFAGKLDNIAIFNRALSGYEIHQLYKNPYALLRPKTALRLSKALAAAPTAGPRIFFVGGVSGVPVSGQKILRIG